MKKVLKWIGVVLLTPILLFVIFAVLLYLPPVQNWAIKHVAAYASEKTGLDITVAHVNLEFPLKLGVEGVKVLQQNDSLPQVKDTVADIHKTVVDVQFLPLLKKQIMVDELNFNRMKVNTTNFVHEARVKGDIGQLRLQAHGIDLGKEHVLVNNCLLSDARISVELSDTVPPDTTPSKNFWKVNIGKLKMKNTDFTLHMPGDTLQVRTYFGDVQAEKGYLDLYKGLYTIDHLDWQKGKLNYDNRYKVHTKGMDFNHIGLDSLKLIADSFYYCDSQLKIKIQESHFRENSGLQVDRLVGTFQMDSTSISLPSLYLKTSNSELRTQYAMDMNAFDDKAPGKMDITLNGMIGKQDLFLFMGDAIPMPLKKRWPQESLIVNGTLRGNLQKIHLENVTCKLPGVARINANGFLTNLLDVNHLLADVNVAANTYDLNMVTAMFPNTVRKQVRIPRNIGLKGHFRVNGNRYDARFVANEGGGNAHVIAQVDIKRMTYQLKLKAKNLQLHHFLPHQGLHPFTGYLEAKGSGTDLMSAGTHLQAKARIDRFTYGTYNLDNILATANVSGGKIQAKVDSHNRLFKGKMSLDALTSHQRIRATISSDLDKVDLYRLRFADTPLIVSVCGHVDIDTDMKDSHRVQGMLSDITVIDEKKIYRPDDVVMDILTRRDTTYAVVDCGDFHLKLSAGDGYQKISHYGSLLASRLMKQFKERKIDQKSLKQILPNCDLYLSTGKDNFFAKMLPKYGFDFKSANINVTSSPVSGLNGYANIDSLVYLSDSIRLDTVRLNLASNEDTLGYHLFVRNRADNTPAFTAKVNGEVWERGTYLFAQIYDQNDQLGIELPLSATMEKNGINFQIYEQDPILGYKKFSVNNNNYVFLSDDGRVSADMKLRADDGQGVQILTNDSNAEALQDVTVSIHSFDLAKILSVIPYAPDVTGVMDGDFHVIQTKDEFSVSSDLAVQKLTYDKVNMGNLETQFVYVPRVDGTHQVNGILFSDGEEVATVNGTYNSKGDGYLDAGIDMDHTPLYLLNGFFPDRIMGLRGYGEGKLTVKGQLSKPDVNGEIYLDSSYIYSEPYGVEMRFANDPVIIENSRLLFENFELFANNDQPLNVSGYFDFSDLDRMNMDVKMRATNFELIDAKENPRSEAYGKAFVNFYGVMQGPVANLQMRGKLDVLGSTDMTYVLKESELTTDNQLEELVKFTDFSDTTTAVVDKPVPLGFDMKMTINVDETAHILCMLNADHTNYIDLQGGGELRMSYNNVDDLQLNGRYTLNSGEMKYSLDVIPLRTFTIQDGSYIEFRGNPYNPRLKITATETIKATVGSGTSVGRVVDFNCGVKLTQTLEKPGIEFIISAPNDVSQQDELNTMSKEERSKIAIAMLASGMYLADGNTSSFSMNSALTSFLNSQINNIAGSAMRSMGLDLGMTVDNSTNASGAIHTDYNFKFSKRLWNNRLSVIVGGRVSTGAQIEGVQNNNNSFFDNVELQYRLNKNSSQYLRGFYDNSTYDWLEGRIGEYGVGFLWRRKLQHFSDILRFKSEKADLPPVDTTYRKRNIEEKKNEKN
jgi:hypothetical protein